MIVLFTMYILSADFGTSSLKLKLLDESLAILRSIRVPYRYEVLERVHVQIDPDTVFKAFVNGIHRFDDFLIKKVEALSLCVLCPSLIAMDTQGRPLYPAIIHLDRRSEVQAKQALEKVGKNRFLEINGNLPFPGGISVTSILWLKEHHPDLYSNASIFGHLNTYLHKIFTGRFAIDPTNASFTGLYETIKRGGWSKELCEILDIDRAKLPCIVPSSDVVGRLNRQASSYTGLMEGIPVVMGANDTSSAALGAGAVLPGSILNISGSNEIITITTDRPCPHERVYLRTHAVKDRWLILAITIGGGALEWFRRGFFSEMEPRRFYDHYLPDFVQNRLSETDVVFSPYLAGDRHSIAQKKASFSGITLDSGREDFLAALLLGIFEPIHMVLEIYEEKVDLQKVILLTGGMVDDAYFRFKAKYFKDFSFKRVDEASTLGNGKLALMGLGLDTQ